MKKLLHAHPNFIIGTLALVFLGMLIAYYSWAVGYAVAELRSALITPPAESVSGFDLSDASRLNLHGLVVATSSSQ